MPNAKKLNNNRRRELIRGILAYRGGGMGRHIRT